MTPTNQKTEQLLTLCKSNNQLAQLEVYNRYYKAMYNTALRIVKDSYKAEDIMQESFLTAFNKLNTLSDLSVFGSWLKRIVINNSIGYYNKIIKENQVPLNEMVIKDEEDDNSINYNETSETNPKVKQILNLMKTLKPNYSVILTLSLIEGYDNTEISEIMKISESNCRTMLSRAKESLRKKLMQQ